MKHGAPGRLDRARAQEGRAPRRRRGLPALYLI
jgi:hypothetical protein